MFGRIVTASLTTARYVQADLFWLITRGGHDVEGMERHLGLSPSKELFRRYLTSWRGKDPSLWWTEYAAAFLEELRSDEKLDELRNLYKAVRGGRDVALVCYCADSDYCHRRLVGQFMASYGIEVTEAKAPVAPTQLALDLLVAEVH